MTVTGTGPYSAFVYDGGQPVMILQRGNNGAWGVADRMVVAGVDRPLAGIYNGQVLALVTDRSGTVQAGVQPNGHADQLATYVDHGPFGEPQNSGGALTGGDVQAGFTGAGGTPNGLGLVYLRNRWYDPQTGRFLTQDPMGLGGGLNLYAYAGNNPTTFSDPFGLCSLEDGYKDCDRMVTSLESALTLKAAIMSGEWTYSQGKFGDPTDTHTPAGGDCTDLVRYAIQQGIGNEWLGGDKASTSKFLSTNHDGSTKAQGFTEVDASMAQPGDVVVKGGHAGLFLGTGKNGDVWAWANNGRPSDSRRGYSDGSTGATDFTTGKWSKAQLKFYRPLHNGD